MILTVRALVFAIILVSIMIVANVVRAEGIECGPFCTFEWTTGTGPTPTGYKLYVGVTANDPNPVVADVGNVLTTTTTAINITTDGQYYARVTGYNVVGESGFSNEVPFILVTGVPGAPSLIVK